MNCCITDLRDKEVINKEDGCRLGNVCDIEVDTCTGKVVAIIVFGRTRWFGLFGKYDDIRICWEDISVIGPDTVLVCLKEGCCCCNNRQNQKSNRQGPFNNFFR